MDEEQIGENLFTLLYRDQRKISKEIRDYAEIEKLDDTAKEEAEKVLERVSDQAKNRLAELVVKRRQVLTLGYDVAPFTVDAARHMFGHHEHQVQPIEATPWQDIPDLFAKLDKDTASHLSLRWIILTAARGNGARVSGASPRGDWNHAVIFHDGKFYDPAKMGNQDVFTGPCSPNGFWWIELVVKRSDFKDPKRVTQEKNATQVIRKSKTK